jgi:hypothetical protein
LGFTFGDFFSKASGHPVPDLVFIVEKLRHRLKIVGDTATRQKCRCQNDKKLKENNKFFESCNDSALSSDFWHKKCDCASMGDRGFTLFIRVSEALAR